MSKPDNIDHFNGVVLHTLNLLYSKFPVPTELKVSEIAELASPGCLSAEATFADLQPTFEAIRFLEKEGFISFGNHYQDGGTFLNVQLTMKGFIVLGQTPGALQPSESLIAKVRGLLATGAKGVGSEAAKVLVSQAFTAAAAAFPVVATILHKT